jgi:hypothetical protein
MSNLKDIKKDMLKSLKYQDDENIVVSVKVYNCEEDLYNVEIVTYLDGKCYDDGTFHIDEYKDEQEALKRAKVVLKAVKGWFGVSDIVTSTVESYHI